MSAGASWPKTESGGKKKKTAKCRPLSGVGLLAQFEIVEHNLAHQGGTLPKDSLTAKNESEGRKKKRTPGKMPLSQVCLPGGEGKSERERKNEKKIFTRMVKLVMMIKKMKPI